MTEREKLKNGLMANIQDPELLSLLQRAKALLPRFNACYLHGPDYDQLLRELVPDMGEGSAIAPPFHCDYGLNIHIGKEVFINYDCVFLDGADIHIGDHVLIGPRCQLLTPQHPFDYLERRKPIEASHGIRIGEDCWLGGGVIVCPGVSIGKRCIIGAGSVVTKDIPDDCTAVGNPARIVKRH